MYLRYIEVNSQNYHIEENFANNVGLYSKDYKVTRKK